MRGFIAQPLKHPDAPHNYPILEMGFTLPGHGEPRHYCGVQCVRGCDNVEKHNEGFGRPPGAVYIELYRRKCMRAVCPLCYEAWAGREGEAAAKRISGYQASISRFRKPIHVVLSPPVLDLLDYASLRAMCYEIAKQAGLTGGMMIFHPWRHNVVSPHFHMIGFGWIKNTAAINDKTGWIVKNKGVRRSTRHTISYLLTHAGIKENIHTVTWWGALSYNKLKVAKMPTERPTCPMCESPLIPLFDWNDTLGDPPPTDEIGKFWIKNETWGIF